MTFYYGMSDIGSVLIGNNEWTFAVPNLGGDGETEIIICDSDQEFMEYEKEIRQRLNFISSVQGNFNIYDHDCAYHDTQHARTLTTLNGRYGVYQGYYKVAFVKWGTLAD